MDITVKVFAAAREVVGAREVTQSLPEGAVVQDLRDLLYARWPRLSNMRLSFAINAVYAAPDAALHDGDEVALIPPVGGG